MHKVKKFGLIVNISKSIGIKSLKPNFFDIFVYYILLKNKSIN